MKQIKERRECETCHKGFKPMTDRQWQHVKYEHDLMSERHKGYLKLKVV